MRVVLDCNVVIAAARTDGLCRAVVVAAVRHHEIVVSTAILDEYREVVGRPKHAAYRNEALTLIAELEALGILVDPDDPPLLPDCDDAAYVATARAGEAEILITGNARHFPLDLCQPVTIFSPRDFFERLMI